MKTFVKFGGIRDEATLQALPEGAGAGFLVEASGAPNNLPIERATELVGVVPAGVETWAVVVNPSAELVHRLFDDLGVDRIQVYGTVPEGLEFLEVHHLIPSLAVGVPGSDAPDPPIPPPEDFPRLHLDAPGTPWMTGSDVQLDWERCAPLVDRLPGRKVTLAGGLTTENVAQALAVVRPWGLDVAAGVRGDDGWATLDRVQAFVRAVESAETPAS